MSGSAHPIAKLNIAVLATKMRAAAFGIDAPADPVRFMEGLPPDEQLFWWNAASMAAVCIVEAISEATGDDMLIQFPRPDGSAAAGGAA